MHINYYAISNCISFHNTIYHSIQCSEIVTTIEATGAMGIFHIGFSSVSKDASNDYLDRVFVDMMWYKAFALFLILRMNINVLFQDVDLVWFKDPFPYFHNYIKETESKALVTGSNVEGFFSDDGQRSLRYAPFYANSGFYYLKCEVLYSVFF